MREKNFLGVLITRKEIFPEMGSNCTLCTMIYAEGRKVQKEEAKKKLVLPTKTKCETKCDNCQTKIICCQVCIL